VSNQPQAINGSRRNPRELHDLETPLPDRPYGVARSNPCFEIWLILHETDFHRPDGRHAVMARLQSLCPEYDAAKGKRPDCLRLIARIGDADSQAERQLAARADEGNPYGPPSTTVFKLTRAIRHAAELARGPSR
jgi:hypothetical protein